MASNVFTPQNIASSEALSGVQLSPDGEKVLYLVGPAYKPHTTENGTSAIWIADVPKGGSGESVNARTLTSGLFNDTSAVFHPDGQRILFLSDRHKAGGPKQIYSVPLNGGEPALVRQADKELKRGVQSFKLSPNGDMIAFRSQDEPSAKDERKETEKDDPCVFMDGKFLSRLRIFSYATEAVRTLRTPARKHVATYAWRADGKEILYTLMDDSNAELEFAACRLEKIAIHHGAQPSFVGTYTRMPNNEPLWLPSGDIIDNQSYALEHCSSAGALYTHIAKTGESFELERPFEDAAKLYGEHEDAADLRSLHYGAQAAVAIGSGVDTRVDVVERGKPLGTLWKSDREDISSWDVRYLKDGTVVFSALKSSAPRAEAVNLWVGRVAQLGESLQLKRVSDHSKWLKDAPKLTMDVWTFQANDGVEVHGIVTYPANVVKGQEPEGGIPTVLLVHGGPYGRDTLDFGMSYWEWRYVLASAGFLVLQPNYRGSAGRGHDFAFAAHAGMGTSDWSDCAAMLELAISKGLADKQRLGIGGWSQGGFMTAWGVTHTKNFFKAGVMGAGVSDWGSMAAESDLPDFEADLGGSAPWTPGDLIHMSGSPIRFVKDVETAVLILHGQKDERVPVSQAISFMRGLQREGKNPERSQLVTYPREPHDFAEKSHAEDVMKRMLDHFNTWLK